jgi:hypothetical protein
MQGLKAQEDVEEGESVLDIPKEILVHLGTAEGSDLVL